MRVGGGATARCLFGGRLNRARVGESGMEGERICMVLLEERVGCDLSTAVKNSFRRYVLKVNGSSGLVRWERDWGSTIL
jgi:hypothetical protein